MGDSSLHCIDQPEHDRGPFINEHCQLCLGYGYRRRYSHSLIEAALSIPTTPKRPSKYDWGSLNSIRAQKTRPFYILMYCLIRFSLLPETQVHIFVGVFKLYEDGDITCHLRVHGGVRFQRVLEVLHGVANSDEETVWPTIERARIRSLLQRYEKNHDHFRLKDNGLYNTPIAITLIDVMENRLVAGSSRDITFPVCSVERSTMELGVRHHQLLRVRTRQQT